MAKRRRRKSQTLENSHTRLADSVTTAEMLIDTKMLPILAAKQCKEKVWVAS